MFSIDEAFEAYEAEISPVPAADVPVHEAVGWVLAADATSTTDLPPFPQSAMDGYAVASADLTAASADSPIRLRVSATIAATVHETTPVLSPGTCARIFTGAFVPSGADAVVMQEHVARDADVAVFSASVAAGQNRRPQADELLAGAVVATAGTRLTPGRVGALAAAGIATVHARRRPRVTLLVTGDEVVPVGQPLRPGQVYDCNTPLATAWLRARGLEPRVERLPDDADETRRRIAAALENSDLVLTTGGVSVGDKDHVISSARAAGILDVFWKVAQKPGKPLYFGVRDDAVLLGLPGNPGAVFVGLTMHVSRILDAMQGCRDIGASMLSGRLAMEVRGAGSRAMWYRCRAVDDGEGGTRLEPLGGQASHMLSNLAECNAIALIPPESNLMPAGAVVRWARIGDG